MAKIKKKNGGVRHMTAGRDAGGSVRCVSVSDEYAEGVFIAKEIGRMVGGMDMLEAQTDPVRQVGFSDIAVLYRTHRQAAMIEQCLETEGIPYIVSGRESYLDAPSVSHALSFFRLCLYPWDRAALKSLLPGVGADAAPDETAESLCMRLTALGGDAAELAGQISAYAPKAGKEKPRRLLEKWKKQRGIQDEEFERLMAASASASDMMSFLSDVLLGAEGDVSRVSGKNYTPDAVRLMTLHGSKGLEFPVVFMAGVKRGVLPLETPYGRQTDLPEERRLFYVGMTRARDELILLAHPDSSPFLSDIPSGLMTHESPSVLRKPAHQLSFL